MDPIELQYDSLDKVPESVRGLYEERDGKAVLSRVNGLKTQKDVDTVMESLRKERNDHATAKNALKAFEGLNAEEVRKALEELPILRSAAEGKIDDKKINELLEPKLAQVRGPLERQIAALREESTAKDQKIAEAQREIETRDRNEIVRSAATESKVHSTAIPDIELMAGLVFEKDASGNFVTKANIPGVTAGQDAKGWLKEMQRSRPHWWPESSGGGAGGGKGGSGFGGANPWSADGWNMTEQGRVLREQGAEVAERMAKAAGTTLGGLRPAKRV